MLRIKKSPINRHTSQTVKLSEDGSTMYTNIELIMMDWETAVLLGEVLVADMGVNGCLQSLYLIFPPKNGNNEKAYNTLSQSNGRLPQSHQLQDFPFSTAAITAVSRPLNNSWTVSNTIMDGI